MPITIRNEIAKLNKQLNGYGYKRLAKKRSVNISISRDCYGGRFYLGLFGQWYLYELEKSNGIRNGGWSNFTKLPNVKSAIRQLNSAKSTFVSYKRYELANYKSKFVDDQNHKNSSDINSLEFIRKVPTTYITKAFYFNGDVVDILFYDQNKRIYGICNGVYDNYRAYELFETSELINCIKSHKCLYQSEYEVLFPVQYKQFDEIYWNS